MTLVAGRGGGHPARHGVVHGVASHRDQDLHEVGRKGLGVDLSSPGLGLSATFEWQMGWSCDELNGCLRVVVSYCVGDLALSRCAALCTGLDRKTVVYFGGPSFDLTTCPVSVFR